jgi:hypothetical protein
LRSRVFRADFALWNVRRLGCCWCRRSRKQIWYFCRPSGWHAPTMPPASHRGNGRYRRRAGVIRELVWTVSYARRLWELREDVNLQKTYSSRSGTHRLSTNDAGVCKKGQYVFAWNAGKVANVRSSVSIPVGSERAVREHAIMSLSITGAPFFRSLHVGCRGQSSSCRLFALCDRSCAAMPHVVTGIRVSINALLRFACAPQGFCAGLIVSFRYCSRKRPHQAGNDGRGADDAGRT